MKERLLEVALLAFVLTFIYLSLTGYFDDVETTDYSCETYTEKCSVDGCALTEDAYGKKRCLRCLWEEGRKNARGRYAN